MTTGMFVHKKFWNSKSARNFLFSRAPAVPQSVFVATTKRKAPEIELRFQGLVGCGSQI